MYAVPNIYIDTSDWQEFIKTDLSCFCIYYFNYFTDKLSTLENDFTTYTSVLTRMIYYILV